MYPGEVWQLAIWTIPKRKLVFQVSFFRVYVKLWGVYKVYKNEKLYLFIRHWDAKPHPRMPVTKSLRCFVNQPVGASTVEKIMQGNDGHPAIVTTGIIINLTSHCYYYVWLFNMHHWQRRVPCRRIKANSMSAMVQQQFGSIWVKCDMLIESDAHSSASKFLRNFFAPMA